MTKKKLTAEIQQKQLDQLATAWSRMMNCVTHDLTTPLSIIRMATQNCEKTLTSLIENYQLAIKNNLPVKSIEPRYLEAVEKLAPMIKQNIADLMSFLNILYPYNQQLPATAKETQLLSIKTCVEQALPQERTLVDLTGLQDFKFNCAPIYIDHLLANLFSNAFRAIQKAKQGEIRIWTETEADYNTLHFKDTALGMDEDACQRVFNRFFSKRDDKTVPGLGFCRLAILQTGGDVLCETIKGQYTEFIIKFTKKRQPAVLG